MLNGKHRLSLKTNKSERTSDLNLIVEYLMVSSIKIHAGAVSVLIHHFQQLKTIKYYNEHIYKTIYTYIKQLIPK